MRDLRLQLTGFLLAFPLSIFVAAMLLWPLVTLLRLSGGALDHAALIALRNSIALSAVVALAATIISFVPAWVLARWDIRGKKLIRTLLTVPLTFSGIVVGFLAILMLGRVGAIPRWSEAVTGHAFLSGAAYGASGLFLAYLYFEIPRAALALESALREIDIAYEAVAATLGLGPLQRMVRVVLPLAGNAIASTLGLTFSVSLGSFGVALLLSRRLTLLPVEVYTAFTGFLDDRRAALLSLTLVVVAIVVHSLTLLLSRARKAA